MRGIEFIDPTFLALTALAFLVAWGTFAALAEHLQHRAHDRRVPREQSSRTRGPRGVPRAA